MSSEEYQTSSGQTCSKCHHPRSGESPNSTVTAGGRKKHDRNKCRPCESFDTCPIADMHKRLTKHPEEKKKRKKEQKIKTAEQKVGHMFTEVRAKELVDRGQKDFGSGALAFNKMHERVRQYITTTSGRRFTSASDADNAERALFGPRPERTVGTSPKLKLLARSKVYDTVSNACHELEDRIPELMDSAQYDKAGGLKTLMVTMQEGKRELEEIAAEWQEARGKYEIDIAQEAHAKFSTLENRLDQDLQESNFGRSGRRGVRRSRRTRSRTRSRSHSPSPTRSRTAPQSRAQRTTTPSPERAPVVHAGPFQLTADKVCAVCMVGTGSGALNAYPAAGECFKHPFHRACLESACENRQIEQHATCPMCRSPFNNFFCDGRFHPLPARPVGVTLDVATIEETLRSTEELLRRFNSPAPSSVDGVRPPIPPVSMRLIDENVDRAPEAAVTVPLGLPPNSVVRDSDAPVFQRLLQPSFRAPPPRPPLRPLN